MGNKNIGIMEKGTRRRNKSNLNAKKMYNTKNKNIGIIKQNMIAAKKKFMLKWNEA
jgi:hypothetical protein